MTVNELIERYLQTRTGVKPNTLTNYGFVKSVMAKEEFGSRKIADIKTSDAKLFLIKMQQDGRGSSTIKTVRGVLRPAFQMAVDDDILMKNPFGFQLAGVIVNTEHTRQAITKEQMNTYTHLGLDDAKNEMIRMEELEQARKEIDKTEGIKPMKQNMFKVV